MKLSLVTKTAAVVFGIPYALEKVDAAQYHIVAYDDDNYTQQATAMALLVPFRLMENYLLVLAISKLMMVCKPVI